jgi:hypothetical protein
MRYTLYGFCATLIARTSTNRRTSGLGDAAMNQDTFNMEVRKFLKVVGVTSQREIEAAVERAIQSGRIKGDETLSAKIVLTIDAVDLKHEITGEIDLG